jgi:pectinesterase
MHLNCQLTKSLQIKGAGSCYLGRPWREYARVVFQNSNLGSNIVAAGWKVGLILLQFILVGV